MKKRYLIYILLFTFMFLGYNVINVKAAEYKCMYEWTSERGIDNDDDYMGCANEIWDILDLTENKAYFVIKFDENDSSKYTFSIQTEKGKECIIENPVDLGKEFGSTEEWTKYITDKKCPTDFKICSIAKDEPGIDDEFFGYLMDGNFDNKLQERIGSFNNKDGKYYIKESGNCQIPTYKPDYSNGDGSISMGALPCVEYDYIFDGLSDLHCKSKGTKCSIDEADTYNDLKTKLINFCSQWVNTGDYALQSCTRQCVALNNDLAKIETYADACGFSTRLLALALNALRWIKYIVPVAVIILSILDFIKALSGDKEDEFKKAQGKFIKRLIIAALIFLAPIFIEFILDKMGFLEYASKCGFRF